MKTQDGITYYNRNETDSFNIDVDGEQNDLYFTTNNYDIFQVSNPSVNLASTTPVPLMYSNGDYLHRRRIIGGDSYFNTFLSGVDNEIIPAIDLDVMLRSDAYKMDGLFRGDSNSVVSKKSNDYISYSESTIETLPELLWVSAYPINIDEIPNGERFVIPFCGNKNADRDRVNSNEQNNIYLLEMIKQ